MSCPSPVSLNMKFSKSRRDRTRLCPCCKDSARGAAGLVEPLTMLSGPFRLWRSLVGGLEHFLFFHRLGMSSSQLTFLFFRGLGLNHQPGVLWDEAKLLAATGWTLRRMEPSVARQMEVSQFHRFLLSQEPAGL